MPSLDEMLNLLTPEALENTIREIASRSGHDTIAVGVIASRVLAGYGSGPTVSLSQAHIKLAQKIAQQVPRIKGMRYIEND